MINGVVVEERKGEEEARYNRGVGRERGRPNEEKGERKKKSTSTTRVMSIRIGYTRRKEKKQEKGEGLEERESEKRQEKTYG